jgi:hypothetical protein
MPRSLRRWNTAGTLRPSSAFKRKALTKKGYDDHAGRTEHCQGVANIPGKAFLRAYAVPALHGEVQA